MFQRSCCDEQVRVSQSLAPRLEHGFEFSKPSHLSVTQSDADEHLAQPVNFIFSFGSLLRLCRTIIKLTNAHGARAKVANGKGKKFLHYLGVTSQIEDKRIRVKQIDHLEVYLTTEGSFGKEVFI